MFHGQDQAWCPGRPQRGLLSLSEFHYPRAGWYQLHRDEEYQHIVDILQRADRRQMVLSHILLLEANSFLLTEWLVFHEVPFRQVNPPPAFPSGELYPYTQDQFRVVWYQFFLYPVALHPIRQTAYGMA